MSNGFDKEAEREKLREKFAEDEEKREHTQRMSELLLQGATMTNRHCDACGDPVFRHDGQEFCPTCHATEDGYAVPTQEGSPAETDQATSPETMRSETTESETMRSETTGAGDVPPSTGSETTPSAGGSMERAADPSATTPTGTNDDGPNRRSTAGHGRSAHETTTASAEPAARDSVEADIAEARASLARTVTRFARAAEETEDPRRAREHLLAAREAAEALAALDR